MAEGAWFDSRPWHRKSKLRFLVDFLSVSQANVVMVRQLYNDRYLLISYQSLHVGLAVTLFRVEEQAEQKTSVKVCGNQSPEDGGDMFLRNVG
jgi:hypothetical protein